MATYRYLGYGITNDKGIAKLEFDENGDPITHSYTGTGAGELDIIASLDDSSKISDSSIQSEIFEVLDATFLDVGTSSNHNDNYFYYANYTRDFTRGEVNTSVDLQDTISGPVTYSVGTGMCFEMDLDEVTNYCQVNVVRTETGKSASYHGQNYTSACKVRIEVLPSQTIFKQIINGVETTLQTINNSTNNTMKIYFPRIDNTDAKFKFRNFMIYPI